MKFVNVGQKSKESILAFEICGSIEVTITVQNVNLKDKIKKVLATIRLDNFIVDVLFTSILVLSEYIHLTANA